MGYYLVASIVYVEGVSPVYGVGFVFAKDRHSGLNYYTPDEVYTGKWKQILARRQAKEQRYYQAHPTRRPAVSAYKAPPQLVGINIGRDLAVYQQV